MLRDTQAAGSALPAADRHGRDADILVRGLTKEFSGTPVLKGVDLAVERGQAVALVGSNGAGKSTLLRCMLRLVRPTSGSVFIRGQEVSTLRGGALRRLRSQVGFVFQRHNLVPRLSVLTNVMHGVQARQRGPHVWLQMFAPEGVRQEAMRCLEMVGLPHVAEKRADQLSGGQSQRVAIARALMQRPRLMFADEPVASLDPNAGEEVMQLFLQLIRDRGLTLIFTSHSVRQALEYSDRVVGLRGGRVEMDAPSSGMNAATLRDIYG